jgi:hypothetical protein
MFLLYILIKTDTSIIHGSDIGGVQLADLAGTMIINNSENYTLIFSFSLLFLFFLPATHYCKLKLLPVRG